MNVKEYLGQIERLEVLIDQKIKELKTIRERATSIGALQTSEEKMPGGRTPRGASFEKSVDKAADLEAEIKAKIEGFIKKRHIIIGQIQKLTDIRYVRLLYLRYIEYKKFEEISLIMNYSHIHIKRLHAQALFEFEKMFLKR